MTEPLLSYQHEGADILAKRRRFGLFDDMGVGKTATTIGALDRLRARRGIVVAPAVVREHWRGEFLKFSTMHRRYVKGEAIHDYVAWSRNVFDVLITSYELAAKWAPYIEGEGEPLDFMVFDEGHYLKNKDAARSRLLLGMEARGGVVTWAAHAYWLTGTPIPNDPVDIFTFLRFCNVMPLDFGAFKKRYFHIRPRTYGSTQTAKADMLPELQALIANNSICRTLAQVGHELPPIFLTSTLVDGDTAAVREMLEDHPGLDAAIKTALEGGGGLSKIDAEHVATLRRLIGEAKAIPYAASLVYDLHNGLDKIVVFGVHRTALTTARDYLLKHGINAVLVNGETPERDRMAYVREFQGNAACRVFLGNIRAAGVGLTLTAARRLDMLESDWTPAGNAQAIKRVHRLTQTRSVMARFITLARSFDEVVNEIVREKTAAITQVTGTVMDAVA